MERRPYSWLWFGLLAAVAVGWWWGGSRPAPTALAEVGAVETTDSNQPAVIWVHVAGWVADPGLVQVSSGGRAADAILAAGGALPGADLDAVNLAAPLSDGQQVVVLGPGAVPGASPVGDGTVHLNQASASELDALPGIGPVIAERIVAHRESHGPFATVEDLLEVPGIGEAKLASLRDLVSVP